MVFRFYPFLVVKFKKLTNLENGVLFQMLLVDIVDPLIVSKFNCTWSVFIKSAIV